MKLSAYADDIVVMIKGLNDIQALTRVSSEFQSNSSAKINWENGQIENETFQVVYGKDVV